MSWFAIPLSMTAAMTSGTDVYKRQEDTRMLAGLPETEEDAPTGDIKTYDVILRVKPEKASLIKSQVINGQKCLVIPMEENEHAAINGVNTTV